MRSQESSKAGPSCSNPRRRSRDLSRSTRWATRERGAVPADERLRIACREEPRRLFHLVRIGFRAVDLQREELPLQLEELQGNLVLRGEPGEIFDHLVGIEAGGVDRNPVLREDPESRLSERG